MEGLVPPTTCPVPYLEGYGGPHELLPIILGRPTPSPSAHLCPLLLKSVGQAGDHLSAFMNSLESCHPLQLSALTHLHIPLLQSMNLRCIANFRDMFQVLQEFYLHASEQDHPSVLGHNVDLTELSTLPLPSTLVSLSIQWASDRDAEAVPDFVAAKNNLISRLPCLRRL